MSRFRFFLHLLLPILTASALLLAGSVAQQTPPAKQATQPPSAAKQATSSPPAAGAKPAAPPAEPPPKPDSKATETLKKAMEALDPRQLGWVDTRLWQQVDTVGMSFQASGLYRSGPEHNLHLDLKVRLGATEGQTLLVSDGAWVWSSMQVGAGEPVVTKYDLKKLEDVLKSPGMMPQVSENFFRSQTFQGVVPLLDSLRQQMVFTRQDSTRWQGHDVFKITGVWNVDVKKALTPQAGAPWPPFTPRQCRLFFDQKAPYWLYRLEWLGPTAYNGDDSILMQMEFRKPRIFKTKDKLPADYTLAFKFEPGTSKVVDRTEQLTSAIQNANRQTGPGMRSPTDSTRP